MSTRIEIWNQNRSALLTTLESDTATEIDGGVRYEVLSNGDAIKAELAGRNDLIGAPGRAVVRVFIDEQPVFHGILADPPSLESPDAEILLILGGREALRKTLMDGAVYRQAGIYQIARDMLARLCPPSLVYDPTQIGDGTGSDVGPGLDTSYSPTATLEDALDELARMGNSVAGVDQQGRPFLGRPLRPPLVIRRGDYPWRTLRIEGRETVTRAVVRVLSGTVLPEGGTVEYFEGPAVQGLPMTVTESATHPEHPLYRAEEAYDGPEGISLVRQTVPGVGSTSPVDPSPALDGDPATGAVIALGPQQTNMAVQASRRGVGFEIEYELSEGGEGLFAWTADARADNETAFPTMQARGVLPGSTGRQTVRAFIPPGSTEGNTWLYGLSIQSDTARSPAPNPPITCTVYSVRIYTVDEVAAQRLAESYLQLPYQAPLELQYAGLPEPTETLTVLDAPGGAISGPVQSYQYQHQPDGTRTTLIRLGSSGQSQVARAIRWTAGQ